MRPLPTLAVAGLCLALAGCGGGGKGGSAAAPPITGPIRINLDLKDPSSSFGVLPQIGRAHV